MYIFKVLPEPLWKGLPIKVTTSAIHELKDLNMDLFNVLEILTKGYDCSRSRRRREVYEKCIDRGNSR